ncbi:hypothetical protein AJ80_02384 [Polytolypa hystricis UAMH7299]|uniref:Uncharacterized protein n=1 Tax=Polytolypa hystricis (strain UAMH7299) TaxID=1447883 RepID=A0A2B7YRI0_POLH7|nr:hypothetical protein AJ80_02384 [Polytolypa hystricis UAMH7299]
MDPLSLTGGIIAILQLSGTVLQLLNESPDSSRAILAIEASSAYSLLTTLRWRLQSANAEDPWFREARKLGVENGPLDQFNTTLERIIELDAGDGQQEVLNEKHHTIIQWLSPLNFWDTQNGVLSRRHKNTGQWLLGTNEFSEWISGKSSTLLLAGIPGAGKTVLTSIIIDLLHSRYASPETGIAFLYCYYKSRSEQTAATLLASLLKLLALRNPAVCEDLATLYDSHKPAQTRPKFEEIFAVLQAAINRFKEVYFVIDALDECGEGINNSREALLQKLPKLNSPVKIMFTARHHVKITNHFPSAISLDVRADEGDVRRFIQERISCSPRLTHILKSDMELQGFITEKVISNADGIGNLPRKLNAVYEEALQRIENSNDDDSARAMRVLHWVAYARQPLTLKERQHALAVRVGSDVLDEGDIIDEIILLSGYAGLVFAKAESSKVRLIHETAQKFFEDTLIQEKWLSRTYEDILRVCVTYLLLTLFKKGECWSRDEISSRLKQFPLLPYPARYWATYADRKMQIENTVLIARLLAMDPAMMESVQAMKRIRDISESFEYSYFRSHIRSGLGLAIYFNLDYIVERLLDEDPSRIEDRARDGSTPLHEAAFFGHERIAEILLDKKASVHETNHHKETPLHLAARNGHIKVLKLSLNAGVSIKVKEPKEATDPATPLYYAVVGRHYDAVKLLLTYEPKKPTVPISRYLRLAIRDEDLTMITLLLDERYADDIRGEYPLITTLHFVAPMHYAPRAGQLLLYRGADVSGKDSNSRTPLHAAHPRLISFFNSEQISMLRQPGN